jgi:hypothetical protein
MVTDIVGIQCRSTERTAHLGILVKFSLTPRLQLVFFLLSLDDTTIINKFPTGSFLYAVKFELV